MAYTISLIRKFSARNWEELCYNLDISVPQFKRYLKKEESDIKTENEIMQHEIDTHFRWFLLKLGQNNTFYYEKRAKNVQVMVFKVLKY